MKLLSLNQRFSAAIAILLIARSFFGGPVLVLCSSPLDTNFPTAYHAEYGIPSSDYQAHFDEWSNKGYRLVLVTGYPSGSRVEYNAIWHQNDEGLHWASYHGMTESEYQNNFDQKTSNGFVPVFVDGFSVDNGRGALVPLINVIYHKLPRGESDRWIARHGQSSAQYQSTFDDMVDLGYHLDVVSSYQRGGEQRLASLFSQYTDDEDHAWEARHGMTEDSYQTIFDDLVTDRGYSLNYVSAGTIDGDVPRFAALFVKPNDNDEMHSTSFRAYHGVYTSDVQDLFDQDTSLGYIPKVMDAYQLRNGALRWVLLFVRRNTDTGADDNGLLTKPLPNGPTYPQTRCFDQIITTFMESNDIPGVGTAVMKDGKVVYAQGYGVRNAQLGKAFMHTPFRVASISKPVTSLAIMRLLQSNELELGDKVFGSSGILRALSDNPKPCCPIVDDRIYDVTIEQLLAHTGGWKSDLSFDPMFESKMISSALGISGPTTCEDIIYYMFGHTLDFSPGTDWAYSNFGFCILGRVIEQVTGQPYQQAVRDLLLKPAGVESEEMYLGSTQLEDIPESEAEYFCQGCSLVDSVFPFESNKVSWPYGGWYLEAMAAHGGRVASAVQLMNMLSVVREPHCNRADVGTAPGQNQNACLLSRSSLDDIIEKSSIYSERPTWSYGLGFYLTRANGGVNLWHGGSLDGTETILVLSNEDYGYAWAFLANTRDFDESIDDLMWEAVGCIENSGGAWPASFKVTGASDSLD